MKPLRSFWRVFWSDRRAAAAAVFLLVEILLVLLLPLFLGQDPNVTDRTAGFWAPPSPAHLLGTDEAGRDLLARLLAGGRPQSAVRLVMNRVTRDSFGKGSDHKDFCEIGTGIMDIQSIINKGNELGAEYIVLEQDHTQLTQMESVRISMDSFHKFSGLDW